MSEIKNITKELVGQYVQHQTNAELVYFFLVSNHRSKIKRKVKLLRCFGKLEQNNIVVKGFDEFTAQDIHQVVNEIDNLDQYKTLNSTKKYSKATIQDYKKILRQFFNWFKNEDKRLTYNTHEVMLLENNDHERTKKLMQLEKNKQIATKMYDAVAKIYVDNKAMVKPKSRADILEVQDYHLLMDATKSVYMRAMITTLFFTGIRVGAILNLKIKDIDRSSDVWKITLHDKGDTRRTVPVTEIKKALIEYLTNYHPNPKPDEYLWVSNNNRTLGKQIEYASLYSQLRQVKRRVQKFNPDWDKPINPHWFRHSWATLNKNIYPDHILKRLGGWCPDSKAINHYDHLSDSDIEEEFSRINGLTPSTTKKTKWDCHTCNTSNFFTDRYCACGTAQNSFVVEEDSIKTQKEQELTQLIMKRIVQDKDLMLRFQEFCKG